MAFPTAVNDQITDSITQSNVKVLADAPAMAMGNLYQATAQALSNAAHNATSAQQNAAIIAQAALTQGISTLYSIDTASTAAQFEKTSSAEAKATSSVDASNAAKEAPLAQRSTDKNTPSDSTQSAEIENVAEQQVEALKAQSEEAQQNIKENLNKTIEEAVKFALECNLGSADRFNHAVREVMDAFISSLQAIAESEHKSAMNTVKMAATIQTLQAMLVFPDKHEQYAKILETVQGL
ncbi:RebB family R body protein [Thalassolituus sp. UBA3500]|uniref:RebB family R body protein n=1 Tax=Thalassolituus sp. UBA3500 TaxID=1947664 RepID=UPI0026B4C85C|tara:strand:- start:9136 stop:9849 length:714 start_codon:yes stop_codon:yes gene_type:complete